MALSSKKYVRAFRLQSVLGLICIVLILAAIYFPWWGVHVVSGRLEWNIAVFPHGVYGDLIPWMGMPYAESPVFLIFVGIFAVCVFLCLLGSVLKGKKGKALLFTAGAILLIMVPVFYNRIYLACSTMGVPVQGIAERGFYEYVIFTGFQLGFYLAILAGLACIVSPLLVYVYEKLRPRPRELR